MIVSQIVLQMWMIVLQIARACAFLRAVCVRERTCAYACVHACVHAWVRDGACERCLAWPVVPPACQPTVEATAAEDERGA